MQCPAMQKTDEELTRPMAQMKPFHDILLQGCPSLTPLPVKLLFDCIPPPPDSMPGFHRDKSPPTASLRSSFSPCIVNILSVFLSAWELLGEERHQGQLWPGVDTEVALPAYLQPLYYTGCVRDQLPKGHCGGGGLPCQKVRSGRHACWYLSRQQVSCPSPAHGWQTQLKGSCRTS